MQVYGEYNCLFQPCLIDAFDEQLLICAISYMKCLLIICFYHAMLASTGISCRHVSVCLSVCLSQVSVLLKWLNRGSRKQWHTIAQGLLVF